MLQKIRNFENTAYDEQNHRPLFHFSSPVGWINDPNGFSCYKGEYHLFYQYNPCDLVWGPMHWGHSVTKDFICWEKKEIALAPDQAYDHFGCFSGTALRDGEQHILMYTGVLKKDEKGVTIERQTQCIAIGDGTDYAKFDCNPVITADLLPKGSSPVDFRDPKLWKDGDTFYAMIGSRSADGSGQLPIFTSHDLKKWEFSHMFDVCQNQYGKMWECPDFFLLNEKGVVLCSPQEMEAVDLVFHGGQNTMYLIGEVDETYHFKRQTVGSIDYGLDFYAPQTLQTEDGRRVMIAWMQSWDNHILFDDCKWSGMMCFPRQIQLKNDKLYQLPVQEIEQYYHDSVQMSKILCGQDIILEGISGRYLDLSIAVSVDKNTRFSIKVAADENYYSAICYDAITNLLTIDRTYSGLKRDYISKRDMKVLPVDSVLTLRILLDRYSVEVFANDGEVAATMLISTPVNAQEVRFDMPQETTVHIIKHTISVK